MSAILYHTCKSCLSTMNDASFQYGKMCCDKPLFGDDIDMEGEECAPEDGECDNCFKKLHGGDNNKWGHEYLGYTSLCDMCYEDLQHQIINCHGCLKGFPRNEEFEECGFCSEQCWKKCNSKDEDDGMEDCNDCGYTHHYEDKCPTGTQVSHYIRWKEDESEEESDDDSGECECCGVKKNVTTKSYGAIQVSQCRDCWAKETGKSA